MNRHKIIVQLRASEIANPWNSPKVMYVQHDAMRMNKDHHKEKMNEDNEQGMKDS